MGRKVGGVVEQGDAAGCHLGNGLLVGVHPEKLPFLRHVDLVAELRGEVLQAAGQAVGKHVGHGDQLDGALRGQRVGGRARATPATTDQRNLDRVVFRRVAPHIDRTQQGSSGQRARCLLQKLATGRRDFASLFCALMKQALSCL